MKTKKTTALLITSALAGGAAHGAIVYTNFNNLTIVGNTGSNSFDLSPNFNSHFTLLYQDSNSQKPEVRGDGTNSFVLARTWQDTNNMDLNNRTYGGLPQTPAGVMVDGQMQDVNPSKQQNGITNLTVQVNGYFNDRPNNTDADSGGGATVDNIGDWGNTTTTPGFVGLVMVNGGVTNFGWAHFIWSDPSGSSTEPNAQLVLVDGAYESTPGKGILTDEGSPYPPSFLTEPTSAATYTGASFALSASVDSALSYQWQAGAVGSGVYANLSDSANFSGSTTPNLIIQSASPANTADYVLAATNQNGRVTSSPATVTIQTPGPTPTTGDGWFNAFQGQTDLTYAGGRRNTSYKASNGKVYWLFDDLAEGTMDPSTHAFTTGPAQVDNKIMLGSGDTRVPTDGKLISVASVPTGAYYYELHDMFEANGYAYVVIEQLGAAFQYGGNGSVLAKFQMSTNGPVTFMGLIPTPGTDSTNTATIQWSDSAVVQNGYVYFFGGVGFDTYLARVPTASVENTNAWTFWNGSSWDLNVTNSAPISSNPFDVVRLYHGDWVTVSKQGGEFGTNIYAYAAAQPQGPYTSQYLFTDPTDTTVNGNGDTVGITTNSATGAQEQYVALIPEIHPEYSLDSGKLLVSIDYWDGTGLTYSYNPLDAGLFKPRFYEVTLTNLPVSSVELNIQKVGNNVVLSWPTGTLLEAPSLSGPWTTNTATSPCTNSPTESQKFYRVLVQ